MTEQKSTLYLTNWLPDSPQATFLNLRKKASDLWNHADWKPYLSTKEGVQVEKLLFPGDPIPYIRSQVTLASSAPEVASYVILDKQAQVEWDPTVDRVIEWVASGNHKILQIPCDTGKIPLIRHRDMVYYEGYERHPNGSVYSVAQSVNAPDIPILPGAIRGELCFVMRNSVAIDEDNCRLETIWQTNMKGRIPQNFTTKGSAKTLRQESINFQKKFGAGPS